MEIALIFEKLGIALGLGLLIGMQRERTANDLAGVRTFPLVTLFGALCALLAQAFGGWIIAAGLVALASMIILGNLARFRKGVLDPGLTTEVAILLMFGVGAYIVVGSAGVAIAIGGVAAVLLHFKGQLHGIVQRFGDEDLKAIMQFVLLSLVILPVLPDRAYGPYAVLNPRQVWWMVVLIVGISLSGYIVYRFFGEKVSAAVGGVLGGAISSTAATVSYARLSAGETERTRMALSVIMTASAVVPVRVLLEIAVVAPGFLPVAGSPLLIILAISLLLAAGCWFRSVREKTYLPAQSNPSELRSALMFGFLYAVVILAIAAAKEQFGNKGLYAVAALSGMTDMDAITLSTSRLVEGGRLDPMHGWRLVVVALMSNLVFKGGAVAFLGDRRLALRVAALYLSVFAVGVLLLVLWH